MHEFEDLVEESVRCLDECDARHLDHRTLFKHLYDFQSQWDTGYTHFRVIEILLARRFVYRYPLDTHPDFARFGSKLVEARQRLRGDDTGWIRMHPGEPWNAASNPTMAYVRGKEMYFDAGSRLWEKFVALGKLSGADAERPREMAMDDVAATVVREAARQSKRGLIQDWLVYYVFQCEVGSEIPRGFAGDPGDRAEAAVARRSPLVDGHAARGGPTRVVDPGVRGRRRGRPGR
jgi:hypothetical protein